MPDVEPLEFVWSDEKGEANFQKHHIDFADAVGIFAGPVYEIAVVRNSELRYKAIGVIAGVEVVVVYTERGRALRIISARRAKKDEREEYQAHCTLSRR